MGILQRLFNTKETPANGARNRKALLFLLELGFPYGRTRKALLELNGIKVGHLLKDMGIPSSSVYRQIQHPTDKAAAKVFAEKLGLEKDELFPELN